MRRSVASLAVIGYAMVLAVGASAQETPSQSAPQPAQTIIARSIKEAKTSHKRVFLLFHATWCGWCKRLDKAIGEPDINKILTANYVITHLDVLEHDAAKKARFENPGADKILETLGGAKSGLPFYAILDEKGKKLADSNVMPNKENIGYPGEPNEIDAFVSILKQTAPHLNSEQSAQLTTYFREHAPKANGRASGK